MGEHEVVEVSFDPARVTLERLVRFARGKEGGWSVFGVDDRQCEEVAAWTDATVDPATARRPDKDPKYYLGRTAWRHVPMTEAQAVRVNATIRAERHLEFVSPRQRELFAFIEAHPKRTWPVVIDRGLAAWSSVTKVRAAKPPK